MAPRAGTTWPLRPRVAVATPFPAAPQGCGEHRGEKESFCTGSPLSLPEPLFPGQKSSVFRDLNLPHNEIRLRTVEKKYRNFPQSSGKEMKVLSLEGDTSTAGMELPGVRPNAGVVSCLLGSRPGPEDAVGHSG